MAPKSPQASKSAFVEWPSASIGSDALESLRDGNPPQALVAFARKAMGAGNHAWAIQYLRRGLEYLRYVITSFPDVADTVQPHVHTVTNVLVDAAAVINDEVTLDFSLPAAPTPAHLAARGWKLLDAKHASAAHKWFARARRLPMDEAERVEHLLRYGIAELNAQQDAQQLDVAFASQLVDIAKFARAHLDSADGQAIARERQIKDLLDAAQQALADANESA